MGRPLFLNQGPEGIGRELRANGLAALDRHGRQLQAAAAGQGQVGAAALQRQHQGGPGLPPRPAIVGHDGRVPPDRLPATRARYLRGPD
ncbi:MAG TPA: hypothetical protein DDZ22_21040, partial [Massilia sp.]|nr:hypothetical protein [Massilia sp.]